MVESIDSILFHNLSVDPVHAPFPNAADYPTRSSVFLLFFLFLMQPTQHSKDSSSADKTLIQACFCFRSSQVNSPSVGQLISASPVLCPR